MRKLVILIPLLLCGCGTTVVSYPVAHPSATTGEHVRLFNGLGNATTSPGIAQIATRAAQTPGVTQVQVYNYYMTQQAADDANAEPSTVKQFFGGYSCGANATPATGNGVKHPVWEAVIQASVWCGAYAFGQNVNVFQETYNPSWFETLGFGAYKVPAGPGFTGTASYINRPDCHPCADTDPDAQNDVLGVIRSVAAQSASARLKAHFKPVIRDVIRYHGQRP
jgi:hypothetical protein